MFGAGGYVPGHWVINTHAGYGKVSMEAVGRLRWVVDNDREYLAHYEEGRSSYRHDDHVAEQDPSSTERVLKNLALIRSYEAKGRLD